MGIQRRDLEKQERTIPVTYGESTFDVTYRPGALSVNDIDDIADEVGEDNPHHALAVSLSRVLVWWDVQDGTDDVAPTDENLRTFPITMLSAVRDAVAEDSKPGGPSPPPVVADGGRARRAALVVRGAPCRRSAPLPPMGSARRARPPVVLGTGRP